MTKWKVSLGGAILGGYIWDDASPNQQGPISLQEVGGGPAVADDFALVSAGGGGGFRPISLFGSVLGLVRGPGSSSDNNLVRWDGTTGQLIQNSGVDLDDSNNLTGILGLITTGAVTVGTNLGVTGFALISAGILTTGAASSTLFNTVATTLAIGGAATTLTLGAGTGTCTIANATVAVTNDLTVGDDLTVTGDISQTGTGSTSFRGDTSKTVSTQSDDGTNTFSQIGYRASTPRNVYSFDASGGTVSAIVSPTASQRLSRIRSRGYGATGFKDSAYIEFYTGAGTISDTSMPGQIQFWTSPDTTIAPVLALTINENQDLLIVNQLLSVTDADSYLNLNGTAGDVELASADDMIFRIDSDNNTTGKTFKWQHNASTDLMTLEDDGDLLLTVGDLIITNEIVDASINNYIDLNATGIIAVSGISSIILDIENDAGSTGSFQVTKGGFATELFRVETDGDVHILGGDLYVFDKIQGIAVANFLDLCYDSNTSSVLLQAYHDIKLDIDFDNAGGGDFILTKNGLGTELFKVANAGDCTASAGNVIINTAGKGLRVKEGSNARMGTATLAGGTISIANTSITATTRILYNRITTGGTVGHLRIASRSVGTNFVITSSSGTETSTVDWFLMEPA